MKPDILKTCVRTMERAAVVIVIAPMLLWLFTGNLAVRWPVVVCVVVAIVVYDVWRVLLDTRRYEAKAAREAENRGPPSESGRARYAAFSVVGLSLAVVVAAFTLWRPARVAAHERGGRIVYTAQRRPFESPREFAWRAVADIESLEAQLGEH